MTRRDGKWQHRDWSKVDLRAMYEQQGMSLTQMADTVGCSNTAVLDAMKKAGIPRKRKGRPRKPYEPRAEFATLTKYLASHRVEGKYDDVASSVRRFLPKDIRCSECGATTHLHVHHITYPARQILDIQILCASCHMIKHRAGMTLTRQIDLVCDRTRGMTLQNLAERYELSISNVSHILEKFGLTRIRKYTLDNFLTKTVPKRNIFSGQGF